MEKRALLRHPVSDAPAVTDCIAEVSVTGPAALRIEYVVTGDISALHVPARKPPLRCDDLWRTTCFELFVELDEPGYAEFNFSPSTCWAAYRFDGYRDGMRPASIAEPRIITAVTDKQLHVGVELDLAAFTPGLDRTIGLSAVIEQADGGVSWWALAHPSERPDFHHRDCFALQLGAAKQI